MNTLPLSADERKRICLLLLKLGHLATPEAALADMPRLRRYIAAAAESGAIERDEFGFSPIVSALETATTLAGDILPDKAAMTACVLAPALDAHGDAAESEAEAWGADVARIYRGLRRVSSLYAKTPARTTDNFRDLLVSSADDMRVVLIMIADRLSLMRRTRDTSAPEARSRMAREAEFLYAPIAHKLGLYKIKSELEDLAVKYLEPGPYYHIKEKLNATKAARDAYIADFIRPVEERLRAAGLEFHIKGRTKSIHSIWQKMKRQHCGFEGVYDLFAIRIILNCPPEREKPECWQTYSIITDMYQPNPKRLRDWLSVPKSNGYESLHTTLLGPGGKWVEVQIRSERMDAIAEYGLAAHWRYKGIKSGEGGADSRLSEIRAALEHGDDLHATMPAASSEGSDIYVFTPKGDLYKLPAGATVLDFAYRIHTGVGNHCVGATIAGKNYPLRHELQSGDQVEIQLSPRQAPSGDWLDIVTTTRARGKIRQALHERAIKEGQFAREAFERRLKNHDTPWDESTMSRLAAKMGYKEYSEFFKAMAEGRINSADAAEKYEEAYRAEHAPATTGSTAVSAAGYNFSATGEKQGAAGGDDVLVIDGDLKGIDFTLAKCCNPIYGDDVFGFVSASGGIKIHRQQCPNARALKEKYPYRIVRARWAGKGGEKYVITLKVVGNDDIGIVNNMTSIIDKEPDTLLRSIRIDTADGLFSGILTISAVSTHAVDALARKLADVHGVKSVTRI